MRTFGERVRAARKAERMALVEAAMRAGISAVELSDIERGQRMCPMETAKRIAEALNCEMTYLNPDVTVRMPYLDAVRLGLVDEVTA